MKTFLNRKNTELDRLRSLVDAYERGLISTPYTRALVDQHANEATQRYLEVIRLNKALMRKNRTIRRLRTRLEQRESE